MDKQFRHQMLPQATHDDSARQNFVQSLKLHISRNITPGNKVVYEQVAKPKFEQEHQHPPQKRHEVRQAMQNQPYYRWWSALSRINQEMLWDAVNTSVNRQLPELMHLSKQLDGKLGSLTLNPDFKVPAYHTAVDIHCMPGGYHSEFTEDDIAAGATYDRGTYVYGAGWLGPLNDDVGLSIVDNYLKPKYPDFKPARILDLGCSVGHSTLPYAEGYKEAEVYAIDISAPMLRYAHARAEALGQRVQFLQQNAEHTNFPDASFDLIVSHILLHEIPVSAIKNVMRECYRLLAPGGMMIHAEAPQYKHMDLFSAFMYDWQTANNNEPYWSAMRDLDLVAVATKAGFAADKVIETFVPNGAWKAKESANSSKHGELGSRGTWFVVSATK